MANQFYVHPENSNSIAMFDSTNFELSLNDSVSDEHIKVMSPYILYWKIDQQETNASNDELGKLYQEAEEYKFLNVEDPIRIYAYAELSPIIQELSRSGLATTKEINFLANRTDIYEKLERAPLPGDVFRISYINKDNKNQNDFYVVVSVSETDINLWRYLHFSINAEQQSLDNIPQKIKDYADKL